VLWLQADNEAPGMQTLATAGKADATARLGSQAYLSGYDAFESLMHTLGRKAAARNGRTLRAFGWHTPASSCAATSGKGAAAARLVTSPLSDPAINRNPGKT